MDELPELRSDEDVDALLARLRAKIAPSVSSNTDISAAEASPDQAPDALTDFIAAHGDATAAMVRALKVLADAIDDLAVDEARASTPAKPTRSTKPREKGSRVGRRR